MAKSRILVIGATGGIGTLITRASVAAGHPTFALVRSSSDPAKKALIDSFEKAGISILMGSLEDYETLLDAVRRVDVVISAVGTGDLLQQLNIIKAIKAAGTIKRFVPSDYGSNTINLAGLPEPLKFAFAPKQEIHTAIREEGIPFTVLFSHGFAGYFVACLGQLGSKVPPRDKAVIFGDGNTKFISVTEEDIAAYVVRAADDPRTENKYVYIRPPANILSQNEMVSLWEAKIGKPLEKTYMSKESLQKLMEETPYPRSIGVALRYTTFIMGSHFAMETGADALEATELYPDVEYTLIDKYLDQFI
ncbi:hypothetical protein L7F22_032000 [Adiantum nelumboides]|nr:hypothetical protein [Adiantum nelumboides]